MSDFFFIFVFLSNYDEAKTSVSKAGSRVHKALTIYITHTDVQTITALTGDDAANYSYGLVKGDYVVTRKTVSLSARKTYDGSADLSGAVTLAGFIGDETLAYSGASVNDANVATVGKYINNITLENGTNGGVASNYQLPNLSNSTAPVTIDKLALIGSIGDSTSIYGDDLVGGKITLNNLVEGDDIGTATYAFDTAGKESTGGKLKVGDPYSNIQTVTAFSGADAGNYTYAGLTSGTYTVTKRALTGRISGSGSSVYGAAYDIGTQVSYDNKVDGDKISATISLNTSGKNANGYLDAKTHKNIHYVSALTGDDANNYSYGLVKGDYVVTPKMVSLSARKTYDGSADLSGDVTFTGLIGDETLSYSGASVNDTHVATVGKYINAITLENGTNGGVASNYQLPSLSNSTAPVTIDAATLTVSLSNSNITKTYDGTTNVPIGFSPELTFEGLVAGDAVMTTTKTGLAYNSADVAVADRVTLSGLSLGALVGTADSRTSDYVLATTTLSKAASISKAALQVHVNNDAKFVTQSDASGYAGVTFDGFVNGQTKSVLDGSLQISRSNGDVAVAGAYKDVLVASGLSSSNYSISYTKGDFTIVPSDQLLVRASNVTNTYGSSADYSISSASYFDGSKVVTLSDITAGSANSFTIQDGSGGSAQFTLVALDATYSSAGNLNAGSYQLSGIDMTTQNSVNFSDKMTVVGSHQVHKQAVSIASTTAEKTYDGTATLSNLTASFDAVKTGDVVTLSAVGAYNNFHAGTGIDYTIDSFALSGADSSNYYLASANAFTASNGKINPKKLTITANPNMKVFDGKTDSKGGATVTGLVSGDKMVNANVNYFDINPGTGKIIQVSNASFLFSDASDYDITYIANVEGEIRLFDMGYVVGKARKSTDNTYSPVLYRTSPIDESKGTVVQLDRRALLSQIGQITVFIDHQIIKRAESFSFNLPDELTQAIKAGVLVPEAFMADGSELPSWIEFDQNTYKFHITEMPENTLPLQLVLRIGMETYNLTLKEK